MIIPMPIHTNSCPCCVGDIPTWGIITFVVILCVFFLALTPIWVDMAADFFIMWRNFVYRVKESYKESIKEWRKK